MHFFLSWIQNMNYYVSSSFNAPNFPRKRNTFSFFLFFFFLVKHGPGKKKQTKQMLLASTWPLLQGNFQWQMALNVVIVRNSYCNCTWKVGFVRLNKWAVSSSVLISFMFIYKNVIPVNMLVVEVPWRTAVI